MIRFITVNFILILFISCSEQDKKERYNPKAIELNNQAVKLIQQFKSDSALLLFDKAIKIDKSYYLPHSNKVDIYLNRKDFKKALHESEMVIKKKPDLAEAWTLAGMLHDQKGDTLIAKNYYTKSIELFEKRIRNPEKKDQNTANRLNRAVSLILVGEEIKGRNALRELKNENPDYILIDRLLKLSKHEYIQEIIGN